MQEVVGSSPIGSTSPSRKSERVCGFFVSKWRVPPVHILAWIGTVCDRFSVILCHSVCRVSSPLPCVPILALTSAVRHTALTHLGSETAKEVGCWNSSFDGGTDRSPTPSGDALPAGAVRVHREFPMTTAHSFFAAQHASDPALARVQLAARGASRYENDFLPNCGQGQVESLAIPRARPTLCPVMRSWIAAFVVSLDSSSCLCECLRLSYTKQSRKSQPASTAGVSAADEGKAQTPVPATWGTGVRKRASCIRWFALSGSQQGLVRSSMTRFPTR